MARSLFSLVLCMNLLACGGNDAALARTQSLNTLNVALFEPPAVSWDAGHAATTVAAKFVVRGPDSTPLGADDVDVQLLLEDRPLDSEATSAFSARMPEVNILYTMVLDATRSLLAEPPAFEPMKQAAQASVRGAREILQKHPGHFSWAVNWFDDFVYRPEGSWSEDALMAIPAPTDSLEFTRLYAAVDYAIEDLPRLQAAVGREVHPVMVVFSDGKDNHTWWNQPASDDLVTLPSGQSYHRQSWPSVSLEGLLSKIANHAALTVHTIGVGTDVDDAALQSIATAGRGVYVKGAARNDIAAVFARVGLEFTTIQSVGVVLPNPPGDYSFTVAVRSKRGPQGRAKFRVHVGDAAARLL